MRALLVHPRTPPTYWGFQHSLPIAGKAASLPPLGLLSLAPLLPAAWEIRVVDENVETASDDAMRWADVIFVTGMIIHAPATREILARAKRLGKRTVVGGPAVNTDPGLFPEADHLFRGEAEGRQRRGFPGDGQAVLEAPVRRRRLGVDEQRTHSRRMCASIVMESS